MKNNTYKMSMLFDFFGDVLTDKQREFFDLYYNHDLSLGEISQNVGITRQGVRDVIVRAEGVMRKLEEKTGIIARYENSQEAFAQIESAAKNIIDVNYTMGSNKEIAQSAERILQSLASLKE